VALLEYHLTPSNYCRACRLVDTTRYLDLWSICSDCCTITFYLLSFPFPLLESYRYGLIWCYRNGHETLPTESPVRFSAASIKSMRSQMMDLPTTHLLIRASYEKSRATRVSMFECIYDKEVLRVAVISAYMFKYILEAPCLWQLWLPSL
jgi:hypothetical protein